MSFLSKAFRFVNKITGTSLALKHLRKFRDWLLPDMPEKDKYKIQRRGSDQFIPLVYGQQKRMHGIVVDENEHGDDDQFLSVLIVFCIGEIESFDKWYFNGVSSDDERWKGKFEIQPFFGSDTQSPVDGAGRLNRWSSTDSHYRGLAGALITFESIQDETIWGGLPEITVDMHGRKVYDPRTDTMAWTENPALILRDYVQLPSPLGKGLSDEDINLDSFIAVANISDITNQDLVTHEDCTFINGVYQCGTGPRQAIANKRFTFNGIIDTEQQIFNNIQEIATAFRGYFPDGDGRLTVAAEIEADPVFDLDASNIVSSITSRLPDKNSRYNQVVVRFPNLENDGEYDEVAWPESDSQTYQDWLEEDDGISLQHTIRTEICGHKAEAIQLARIAALVSRFGETVEFTGAFEAAQLDVGDVVTITEENRGWDKREFRIDEINYRDDGLVDITAEQHDNAFYPWVTLDYTEIIGGINLGDPFNPEAPTGLQLVDDNDLQTTGRLQWNGVGAAFVRYYGVEIHSAGELVEQYRTTSQRYTLPLFDVGSYEARVYSVSTVDERRSPPATLSFSLVTPVAPTDLGLTASNNTITVRPSLPGRGLGTQFEAAIVLESDSDGFVPEDWVRGDSIVFTGLNPNTLYRVFARTVNPLGVSAWVSDEIRTTESTAELDYLLDKSLPFIDLRDRVDEEFERSSERLDGLEVDTRIERFRRDETDAALIESIVDSAGYRDELRRRIEGGERLINAVVDVDPETGRITNRAYEYADDKFSEASLIIDGVQGQVNAAVQRITLNESEVEDLSAEFDLLPGLIEMTANAVFAEGIAALQPAHSFNFFDSAQGWVAISGTLTPNHNKIVVTHGDIENTSIEYNGEEDPSIRIALTRTAGEGWTGDVVVYFDDATQHTFEGVIDEVSSTDVATIRNLDFRGSEEYHRDIVGLRLVLGADDQDEFEITAIAIGKPDAALLELEGVIAQVTEAGIRIDALDAEIEQRVTRTEYDATAVKRTDFSQILNADEGYAEIRGVTQQIVDNDVVEKANAAGIFIDETFTAYSESIENRLDDESELNETRYTNVQQELDAVGGTLTNQVFSISRLSSEQQDALASQIEALADYGLYVLGQKDVEISFARSLQQLRTDVSPDGALAQSILDLEAVTNQQNQTATAWLQRNERAITDTQNALTQSRTELEAQIEQRGEEAEQTATANATDLLNARVGYCTIDGQPTGAETPDECSASGGEWVSAPLAEVLRTVRVTLPGGETATVSQLAQAFEDKDGQLIARGGIITDNAGRMSGVVNTNTGETSQLDMIAALTRIGDIDDEGNFIPLLSLDAVDRLLNIRARLVLKDGHVVEDLDDIRAEDGKDGKDGIDGQDGLPGADGKDGADGISARSVVLTASKQAIKYNSDGTSPNPTSVEFTAAAFNIEAVPQYRFYVNDVAQGNASSSNTFTYTMPSSVFDEAIKVEVELIESGVIVSRDEVNLFGLQDGADAITVVVSNRAHVVPSDADGSNPDLTGSGTTIRVFEGTKPLVFTSFNEAYPSGERFNIYRNAVGIGNSNVTGQGTTTANIGDYGWMTSDSATATFSIRIRKTDGSTLLLTEVTNFAKSKKGDRGADGADGQDGLPGAPGAGFFSGEFPTINWGVARDRFRDVVGRYPIPGDIFVMTTPDGGFDARKRNAADDSWVAPGILLDGDFIASGTVGARQLTADAINGRVIRGSLYITETAGGTAFEVRGAPPFGAQSNLYMWYGRKNTQTWNSTTREPRLNGLTTLNSIEHQTITGERFFGGTFQAGTLSLSRQTTNSSGPMIVETGAFTIPGNTSLISIASSLAVRGNGFGDGSCPTNMSSSAVIVDIERLVGNNWEPIGGDNSVIDPVCTGSPIEHYIEVEGGVTATTQLNVTAGQTITLRAVGLALAFPNTIGDTNITGQRSLSIVISGG